MGFKAKLGEGLDGSVKRNDDLKGTYFLNIQPMGLKRQRLADGGMTDEDRALRKQWLEDQYLTDREPVRVPNLIYRNEIRRFYGYPYDMACKHLMRFIGPRKALVTRYCIGRLTALTFGLTSLVYIIRHNRVNWERGMRGVMYWDDRKPVFPGDPGWENCLEVTNPEIWVSNKEFFKRTVFCDPTKYKTSTETATDMARGGGGAGCR